MNTPALQFWSRFPAYLKSPWNWLQLGVLTVPFSPILGGWGLLWSAILAWWHYSPQILRQPVNWVFAAFDAWLLVSTLLADRPLDAFLGLFNFIQFPFIFAGLVILIRTPAQVRQLTWMLVLTAFPVVLIGVGQLFWGWGGHVEIAWVVINWVIQKGGHPEGRMDSIFTYANILAYYLVIVLNLGLGLWFDALRSWRHPSASELPRPPQRSPSIWITGLDFLSWLLNPTRQSPRSRWLILSAALLGIGVALIFTDSRNGWAIACLSCLAFAVYQGWRWLVFGVLGFATSILTAAFGPQPVQGGLRQIVPAMFWARISDELYPDRPVAELRRTQWQFAWSLTQQRPLTGWGLRSFTRLYEAQMDFWLGHPHNLLVMLMAETGIPGALLLFGAVGWILTQACLSLRRWFSQESPFYHSAADRLLLFSYIVTFMACTLFHGLDITFFDLRINLLGWFLLAAIASLSRHPLAPQQQED